MTLIAYLPNIGAAFSDVLMSMNVPGGHMKLPTGDTSMVFEDMPIFITGMKRKFFRLIGLREAGMFLVAGTVSHIEKLVENIEAIRIGAWRPDLTEAPWFDEHNPASVVEAACLKTESEGSDEFEIIGVVGNEMFVRNFDISKVHGDLGYFGQLFVAGSGGMDLYHWLAERAVHYVHRSLANDEPGKKLFRALNSIPLMLLRQDRKEDGRTIKNGVGGYYESYIVCKGSLVPIEHVLTMTASVRGRGSEVYLELERLYYHRYVGDFLLVVSYAGPPLQLRPGQPCVTQVSHFDHFEIEPLLNKQEQPNWTASRMLIEIPSAKFFRLALTRHNKDHPVTVRFGEGIDERRLLRFEVRKEKIVINVDDDAFAHYLSRFPANLPEDNQPILVHW